MATKGFAAPEVKATYTRARELCQQVGETPQLFPVLCGLMAFYHVRGEFHTARELGEQLLSLAQREQDPALLVEAYWALGRPYSIWVSSARPERTWSRALTLYDPQQPPLPVFLYGSEPGVSGLSYAALVLWIWAIRTRHCRRARSALPGPRAVSSLSLAFARDFAALLHQLRRERPLTQERAEAAITLATRARISGLVRAGALLQGWALAEQGQREEGITQIRQGMAAYRAIGAELLRSVFSCPAGRGVWESGAGRGGLAVLAEALAVVDKNGERFYEAELYRLKGELTLHSPKSKVQSLKVEESPIPNAQSPSRSRRCFLKAIEIARKQQAKSLELRAAMSLARLWQQQGKKPKLTRCYPRSTTGSPRL